MSKLCFPLLLLLLLCSGTAARLAPRNQRPINRYKENYNGNGNPRASFCKNFNGRYTDPEMDDATVRVDHCHTVQVSGAFFDNKAWNPQQGGLEFLHTARFTLGSKKLEGGTTFKLSKEFGVYNSRESHCLRDAKTGQRSIGYVIKIFYPKPGKSLVVLERSSLFPTKALVDVADRVYLPDPSSAGALMQVLKAKTNHLVRYFFRPQPIEIPPGFRGNLQAFLRSQWEKTFTMLAIPGDTKTAIEVQVQVVCESSKIVDYFPIVQQKLLLLLRRYQNVAGANANKVVRHFTSTLNKEILEEFRALLIENPQRKSCFIFFLAKYFNSLKHGLMFRLSGVDVDIGINHSEMKGYFVGIGDESGTAGLEVPIETSGKAVDQELNKFFGNR